MAVSRLPKSGPIDVVRNQLQEDFDLQATGALGGSGNMRIISGNYADKPVSPRLFTFYWSDDLTQLEFWTGSEWKLIA